MAYFTFVVILKSLQPIHRMGISPESMDKFQYYQQVAQ